MNTSVHKFSATAVVALSVVIGRDAWAECTMDVDCKGDRICVSGGCVDGPPRPAAAEPSPAPVETKPVLATQPDQERGERQGRAFLVGGIVLLSLAPVAFATALVGAVNHASCPDVDAPFVTTPSFDDCHDSRFLIYGGGIATATFLAGGLPLLLIGIAQRPHRKPATTAIAPWLSTASGGLSWRASF